MDDGIFASPSDTEIDQAITEIGLKFDIEDQGTLNEYIGVNIQSLPNGKVKLSQHHLIDQIINLAQRAPLQSTPANSIVILQRDLSAPPFNHWFHYRSIVGNNNFLRKCTRGNISNATHQVTRFCEYTRRRQGTAIKHLSGYISGTQDDRLILDLNHAKSFEVYPDADFCGNQYKSTASNDPLISKSRSGYLLVYVWCPIVWASKMKMVTAVPSTESESVFLQQSQWHAPRLAPGQWAGCLPGPRAEVFYFSDALIYRDDQR